MGSPSSWREAWLRGAAVAVLISGFVLAGALLSPSVTFAAPIATTSPGPDSTAAASATPEPAPTDPAPTAESESGAPEATPIAPTPEPTDQGSAAAPARPSLAPTRTPSTDGAVPQTPRSTAEGAPAATRPLPPAWDTAHGDPLSWVIAVAVLTVCAVIVAVLVRHDRRAVATTPAEAPSGVTDAGGVAARLAGMEAVGEAMLDAGYSVTGVRATLRDIAAVNGHPDTEMVVFPTALFVSTRAAGAVRTGAVASGERSLALNQIDALDDIVTAARTVPTDPADVVAEVAAVRALPSPYSVFQQVIAYASLSGSLAVLLGASWVGVVAAGVLGLLVGTMLVLVRSAAGSYQALVTVGLSFGVSAVVFTLTQLGLDPGVLAALIAPLVTFLPGGLLTTGVIELSTGQMMAGAGRIAAGLMQLVLLAAGIVGGASLVGVPALTFEEAASPVGSLGPWLAVVVFGVAITIYSGGRRSSIPWVVLVLYVAYGAQVVGDIFFGGVLSALIGALVMTPVAYLVSRQRSGPAAFATFLPAFWMLVPGALGLVGMAGVLDGDSTGLSSLSTMISTMVAITLGILAGSAIGSRFATRGTVVAV